MQTRKERRKMGGADDEDKDNREEETERSRLFLKQDAKRYA